ncbi:PP2C family protein-serine/threonine phosphatase [Litoribacter ruber]|uniref:PP2C family protein-serine/threonine phosphatase n=1 Tax=Litoribacter ruber TaxID=702568 RepID=A0AAP2G1G0_9BACT|nr:MULTISPECIES: PP2C family protein-serine/threonine phosphatase [Litoribacter]MBS9524107.1 PP2C family protein-serine/threonine phosphatase [Litoribacter alkaliphilus]MBT0811309.1 PP2C family protein-serine/threonine phosphatase [Litoribacter ruber]
MTAETVKFQRKELELKALLEITQAINENKSESVLLNIYKFTTLVHLNIKSLVLYVANQDGFESRVAHGVKEKIPELIPYKDVEDNKEMGKLSLVMPKEYSFSELDFYIPVYHKDKMLAILLLKRKGGELDMDYTQALTNILVVALENKRFARKQLEQERLKKEIEIASNVQRMLFPASLPETDRLKAKVTYVPHSTVGGDYYDFVKKSEDEVFFCIADVSGKGMPAALLMSNFQAALRTLLRSSSDLEMIVHQLNYTIFENTKGERFITFFLGYYNYKTQELTYVNAGHNPPLLCWEGESRSEQLEAGTTILGAFEELPFLTVGKRENLKGFTLHLYTDGLTETFNDEDEEYGDERFGEYVRENLCMDPVLFHEQFFDHLQNFSNGKNRQDDITLMSLRFK